jgi:hypothetical protein
MSRAEEFLDKEEAFDKAWHPGLLYKLYKLKFSTNLIELLPIRAKIQFLSKAKYSRLEKYKQECLKVPASPQHCVICI